MIPRGDCEQCGRTIAVNVDGRMRSHYCPHRVPCEPGRCERCVDVRRAAAALAADSPAPPIAYADTTN
jgi:hypothetical protein